MPRRPLIAGNWKMNGSRTGNAILIKGILDGLKDRGRVDIVVCPPTVYLATVGDQLNGSGIGLGGQDVSEQEVEGALTGDIHASMLTDVGCSYVIVGHSERREIHGESDALVAHKVATALACGLVPIVCVGEKLQDREAGATEQVLSGQLGAILDRCGIAALRSAIIAYEPVWAIGTGRTASPELAQSAHAFLRGQLSAWDARIADDVRILYGGSVKPDNAKALFSCADIDGGLIGGASLKAPDFLSIIAAYRDH